MKKKQKISMDDIAEKAKISRATLYRYYSNIDILVTEAFLHIQFKSPDQLSEEVNEMPLLHRIHHIQKHYNTLSQKNEIVFRRYISAVLKESIISKKQLRGARRIESLNKKLAKLRIEKESMEMELIRLLLVILTQAFMFKDSITVKAHLLGPQGKYTLVNLKTA